METKIRHILLGVFLLTALILGFSSAIRVTDLNIEDRATTCFVVKWNYSLDGYNSSRLLGFELIVSTLIFDKEVA